MRPVWHLGEDDIVRFQGRDVEFADFMNELLRTTSTLAGIPLADQLFNLRTKVPDGGIDAEIRRAISPGRDSSTGWFAVPTCWQFKGCKTESIKLKKEKGKKGGQEPALRKEVNKPYAKELIERGYGYRLCIAASMPPGTITTWEKCLTDEIWKINAGAPEAKVISADQLAQWANHFPGTIKLANSGLKEYQILSQFKEEFSATKIFVEIPVWTEARAQIREFADFTKQPTRAVLSLQGEAGVGKSRCVYETLAEIGTLDGLVVYTSNELTAEHLAAIFVRDSNCSALIVADECGLRSRLRLEQLLQSHSRRVRAITIDNGIEESIPEPKTIILQHISEESVQRILQENYPSIPEERRWSIARISGGFVRCATALCDPGQAPIPPDGWMQPAIPFFRNYLAKLVSDDLEQILAVSLLPRVGYREDVGEQLAQLCEALKINSNNVIETARRRKQSPGFIAIGERYLYITPLIIAHAAFQSAWDRWIDRREEAFFVKDFPGTLLEGLALQVNRFGSDDMKRAFGAFFQNWSVGLTPADLKDEEVVRRLACFVEIDPSAHLPTLRKLVESISIDMLRELHISFAHQQARRQLVSLCQKLIQLPECFWDAEPILFYLALAETEPYSNNATNIWTHAFRPFLSGTTLPFTDRLRLLVERFQTDEATRLDLCFGALGEVLGIDGPILGHPQPSLLVAGRLPPTHWYPRTNKEEHECWELAVAFLSSLADRESAVVREKLLSILTRHLAGLIRNGFLNQLQAIVSRIPLSDQQLAELLEAIDTFSQCYITPKDRGLPPALAESIKAWRQRLVPSSIHGRLVAVLGQPEWNWTGPEQEAAASERTALARAFLADPTVLDSELVWLCSAEAKSAGFFGDVLAREDREGLLFERILTRSVQSDSGTLGKGYLFGILKYNRKLIPQANTLLDRFESIYPKAVYNTIVPLSDDYRGLTRLVRMVDQQLLPIEFLQGVNYGTQRPLTSQELREIVNRLLQAARAGNPHAATVAVSILWMEDASFKKSSEPIRTPIDEIVDLIPEILQCSLHDERIEERKWGHLLSMLIDPAPLEAIRLGTESLMETHYQLERNVIPTMVKLAKSLPEEFLEIYGAALLSSQAWRLGMKPLQPIIAILPSKDLLLWLDNHPEASKIVARHLPSPFLDDQDQPIVPDLTLQFLDRFGERDKVLTEFQAGIEAWKLGALDEKAERLSQIAKRFVNHPSRFIRSWANRAVERARALVAWSRQMDEELLVN